VQLANLRNIYKPLGAAFGPKSVEKIHTLGTIKNMYK
jgi:hypothetical protein